MVQAAHGDLHCAACNAVLKRSFYLQCNLLAEPSDLATDMMANTGFRGEALTSKTGVSEAVLLFIGNQQRRTLFHLDHAHVS